MHTSNKTPCSYLREATRGNLCRDDASSRRHRFPACSSARTCMTAQLYSLKSMVFKSNQRVHKTQISTRRTRNKHLARTCARRREAASAARRRLSSASTACPPPWASAFFPLFFRENMPPPPEDFCSAEESSRLPSPNGTHK